MTGAHHSVPDLLDHDSCPAELSPLHFAPAALRKQLGLI